MRMNTKIDCVLDRRRGIATLAAFMLAFLTACYMAVAQTTATNPVTASTTVPLIRVPIGFQRKVKDVGLHFTTPGNERLTFTGMVKHGSSTPVPMIAVYELPRKFKYQEGSQTLVFNGASLNSQVRPSADDLGVLESLFEDSMDGLFPSLAQAGLFRHLMNGGRLDDGLPNSYKGPLLSVFQVVLPASSLPGAPQRTKHLFIVSQTNLLDRVRYFSGGTSNETTFQNWRTFNGTFAPTLITRKEAGVMKFAATISAVSVAAAANDNTFALP